MHSYKNIFYLKSFSIFLLVCALGGCSAQLAYREGKDLISQDRLEDGLDQFKQAMMKSPGNLEYRKAYLNTREQIIYSLSEQADFAIKAEKYAQAKSLYLRIQRIDPTNEQAKTGFQKIELYDQHALMLSDAQLALDKKDFTTSQKHLKRVLAENPANVQAIKLNRILTEQLALLPQEAKITASYKKAITIEFKDAPIKQVFEVISRTSGINFLFDRDVKTDQRTSIFLKNSTIESAIHFCLLTNQLEKQVLDSNTILIYPNSAAKQKEYQEMVVRTFFLTNAEAKTVANTLKTIVKTRDVVIDEKLNMLIVRDSPDAIRLAEKLVALQDVAEPEVMLEVEILEIKRTRLLDLGIQWPNSLSLTPLSSSATGALTLRDLRTNINGSTIGAGLGPVTIKARREVGDANLLANPRIRARNHEKAKILIGERVPNITTTATSTGFVSESINYIEVGLKLEVEPTVYLDNDVAIKIALEVSSVTNQLKTQSGSVAYQIGTRTASTVLRLKNGETQVLAGLLNDEERNSGNKVPGIGELPIVGRLFGSQVDDSQKTEIVLSITPHLIRNIQQPDIQASEFNSGTDSSFRVRSDVADVAQSSTKSPQSLNAEIQKSGGSNSNNNVGQNNLATSSGGVGGLSIGGGIGSQAGAPQLQWQGPRTVKIGDVFSTQLIMQSDQPVVSVPLTLGFNPQVLEIVSVTEGVFMKQGGAQTNFASQIDPKGQVILNASRSVGGASSPGSLVTFTIRALAPSESAQIQMLSAQPVGVAAKSLSVPQLQTLTIEIQP